MQQFYAALFLLITLLPFRNTEAHTKAKKWCCGCFRDGVERRYPSLFQDSVYTFVKSFSIDGRRGERPVVEYTAVFSEGTSYKLVVLDRANHFDASKNAEIIATVYNHKREEIATTQIDSKVTDSLTFTCPKQGIYYIRFTFATGSQSYCGKAILSFKKE